MTDEKRGRSGAGGFDQGTLLGSVQQAEQMIAAWFDEVDSQKYFDAYRKVALSGPTGALEALAKKQVGATTESGDRVDVASFLADAWLGAVANAWAATREVSLEFLDDLARYLGTETPSKPKRAAAKKTAKKATKATAKKAAKKTAKKRAATSAKKTVKKTAATSARKTVKKTAAKTARTASPRK